MTDDAVRLERDFYRRLLELDESEDIEGLLSEALALIVEITGARCGYIELTAPEEGAEPFSLAHDLTDSDVSAIRARLSAGIIAEAMASGETVATHSAMDDARFAERVSVRQKRIEAVLCAPIGRPSMGVIYLQGRTAGFVYSPEDTARLELFAQQLAHRVDRLLRRLQYAQDIDHTAAVRQTLRGADGFIGRSAALARVLKVSGQIAPLDLTVLLTGETGTGKSAVARLIHTNSDRSGSFVVLSCANFQESLFESELFGAVRGAHSTATRNTDGKVKEAEGGTLFLDEVAEMPLSVQARFLQFLQDRTYYPLGSTDLNTADVRIIAATHKDLEAEVEAGRFRRDLLYRLKVFTLGVPALSERSVDIPVLARHFCQRAARRHRLDAMSLSAAALAALRLRDWPGNVRELESTVVSAVVSAMISGERLIAPEHLTGEETTDSGSEQLSYREATHQFQRQLLESTLKETNGNVTEAAKRLSLKRSYLHDLLKKRGVKR